MFRVLFSVGAVADLASLRAFDRRRVLDAVEVELVHEPGVSTCHRKLLPHLVPPFEAVPPVWELRVGDLRVFYDLGPEARAVHIRAVRRKPAHRTTEEIL